MVGKESHLKIIKYYYFKIMNNLKLNN